MLETYNQESFIKETMESIINQNFSFPYEIIIGDDCSKDKTPEILDEYAKKYPQITVIHNKENLGAMGNYYNVLSKTRGKYIMDCAGDDYWLPGKVKTQINYMEKHPDVGMCYGQAKNWNENKKQFEAFNIGEKCEKFQDIFLGNSIPALTVCLRGNLIRKYLDDVKPQNRNWRMEDLPEWLWFAKESKIKYLPQTFGVYRVQSESESHFVDEEKKQLFEKSCNDIRLYYVEKYNKPEFLNYYSCHWGFISAWQNRNAAEIIKNWKGLCLKDRTLKNFIKYCLACGGIIK